MSTQHTPGPWYVGEPTGFMNQISVEPAICAAHGTGDELKANAHLIAAAPDLLEALRIIGVQSLGSDWSAEQAVAFMKEHARAAIAKATGGAS